MLLKTGRIVVNEWAATATFIADASEDADRGKDHYLGSEAPTPRAPSFHLNSLTTPVVDTVFMQFSSPWHMRSLSDSWLSDAEATKSRTTQARRNG